MSLKSIANLANGVLKSLGNLVENELEKGDKITNEYAQAFLVALRAGTSEVIPLEMNTSVSFRDNNDVFACDTKGWYYVHHSDKAGAGTWFNGKSVKSEEKYYLYNEDVVALQAIHPEDTQMFLFSIMNQKNTCWNSLSPTAENIGELGCNGIVLGDKDDVAISPNKEEKLYLSRSLVKRTEPFPPFRALVVNDRHFIYDGRIIYYQLPLKDEEHISLALLVNQLREEETLKVNIRERTVSGIGQKKRKILEDVQLDIKVGEMVLVLGSSGAGKTTFLNAVMGFEKADADVFIGSYDLYKDFAHVKHMIGYVPQQDTLRDYDTVYMTLKNAAQLKLPREFTADSRLLENRICETLNKLNIAKESQLRVGKLSGGQRKRVSIAVEYISEPAVFFLDEPDSGLDGSQARSLMRNLREIANSGKMVVVISHNPDRTPNLYDKVVVLAQSKRDSCGRLAFYGSLEDAFKYFDVETPELIVEAVEEKPDYYIEKYKRLKKLDK